MGHGQIGRNGHRRKPGWKSDGGAETDPEGLIGGKELAPLGEWSAKGARPFPRKKNEFCPETRKGLSTKNRQHSKLNDRRSLQSAKA